MGAAGGQALTRADVEAWSTEHLETAATHWTSTAREWESHFETIHNGVLRPGGTTWEGDGADAAAETTWGDLVKVRGAADGLHAAAGHATNGAGDVAWAKRQVLSAIAEAEQDGFTVGQDFSVTDKSANSLVRSPEGRQSKATEHANDIASAVRTLVAADKQAGERISSALAPLAQLSFPERGGTPDPTVRMVDNHFKRDEPKPDPPPVPKERHATDPNRSVDGTYGPGNFGDGKAAEKAALDEAQRRTQVPIIRQQVRATQSDVISPKTGKPQERYYDGLQPTGNPDEYIGYEAKTNPNSLDKDQQTFDKSVNRDHPARAMLNGRPITIVDARTVYPPEGWVPPSVAAGLDHPAATPAPAPSATTGYPGMPEPPKMWRADGAPPVQSDDRPGMHGGSSNPFPNLGTHISPDELTKSDDPELRNFGKFYQGMFGRDPNNPDNHA